MKSLEENDVDCASCDGHCCSYKSNSMQITPLETLELLNYLKENDRWTPDLKETLKDCVTTYRLDKDISTGKNSSFRRTYTCPFYIPGPKGCSISLEIKPYGCLAFNPRKKGSSGENCKSNIDLLQLRDKENSDFEEVKNSELKETYQLWWNKLAIPVALLEFEKQSNKLTT